MIAIICCKAPARQVPLNYILLFIFTICESYIVATLSSFYDAKSVLLSAFMALALFGLLTLFAFVTKGNLKACSTIVTICAILGLILMVMGFFIRDKWFFLLICWVGLICACIYTVFDVYLIKDQHGLEYDDYIIGALLLYTDLITIFIYILQIFGS